MIECVDVECEVVVVVFDLCGVGMYGICVVVVCVECVGYVLDCFVWNLVVDCVDYVVYCVVVV